MAAANIRKEDDYPEYTLNGVQSYRWVKPSSPSDMVNFDQTDITCSVVACRKGNCGSFYCSKDGCPATTQAFYALTETGDVYVTTQNGVIFYLPSGSDKDMRVVYPVNHTVTAKPIDTNTTGITLDKAGKFTVKFNVENLTEPDGDDVVSPELPRVYPWRPGSDHCTTSVVAFGEKAGNVSSFIIGDPRGRDFSVRPKCYAGNSFGSKLTFPYSNGYYCVQTEHNRCVVFYRGEEIYNGEYSGYGISAPFGYGLTACISEYGCNPRINDSRIEWTYSLLPTWLKTDDDHFIITTKFDEFVKAHEPTLRDEAGKIVHSNILIRKEDATGKFVNYDEWRGYFAVDPEEEGQYWETLETKHRVNYEPKKKYRGLKDFLKRRDEDYEPGPGVFKCSEKERRFDIYKLDSNSDTGLGDCIGYVVVYVEREHIVDEGRLAAVRKKIAETKALADGTTDALKEFKTKLEYLKEENLDNPMISALENTIEGTTEDLKGYKKKLSELEDEEREILGPEDQEDSVTGEFHGVIRLTDPDLQNEVNDNQKKYRVWWIPSKEEVWCGTYADERVGIPAYACDYKAVFRSDENLSYTRRTEEGGLPVPSIPPRNYYWYVGNGMSENNPDSNFQMSRWREELCVSCTPRNDDEPLPEEVGTSPCPCELDVLNGYTTNNNCLFTNHETMNASVCGKCNYPIDLNDPVATGSHKVEEPCWKHDVGCPPAAGDGKTVYKLSHYCKGEIGRVDLENLGGRINSIFYEDGTESDWAYINRGEPACRTKKDYSIIGEIKGPEELPGIYNYNPKLKKTSYQRVDVLGANAVILRAPASKCKPVEIDGQKVCEGDIINTSITTFPRGGDYLIKRTITNKKTKAVKCFNFFGVNPINGFLDLTLDGQGVGSDEASDSSQQESSADPYPCLGDNAFWTVQSKVIEKDEDGNDQEVYHTFRIPKDSHGNNRGDYVQVEVTSVERTIRKEIVKDDGVEEFSEGSTVYTWSLDDVNADDSDKKGVSYQIHGRTFVHNDSAFWGEQVVSSNYDSRYGDGYVKIAGLIPFENDVGYLANTDQTDSEDSTKQLFSTISEQHVSFTKIAADNIKELAVEQTQADEDAIYDDGAWHTMCVWYCDIKVKAEDNPDIEWTCRQFSDCFVEKVEDYNDWGMYGLPHFIGSTYGSCVPALYFDFSRHNFSGLAAGGLSASITVTNYGSGYNEESVVYETTFSTSATNVKPSWRVDGKSVRESDQISWSPVSGRQEVKAGDSGLIKGVTHYHYDDSEINTGSSGGLRHKTKFDIDFTNAIDYKFTEISYVTRDDKKVKKHTLLTLTKDINITGEFQVEAITSSGNDFGIPIYKKQDFREVRYKFMRFYPAYLTRPDYYFKMNDAENEVTAKYQEDTASFMKRLREWSMKPEPKTKGGDDSKEKMPSANPHATCSKQVYTLKYAYTDNFYDFQNVQLDPFFTEYNPREGFAYDRSDYTASRKWKFVGYDHDGNDDEDSLVNGNALWYAKWQLMSDEHIIVRVPFPKPQGRCYNYSVRHLSKFRNPSQGVWYCTGPAGSEQDALANYLGSEMEIIDDGDTTKDYEQQTEDDQNNTGTEEGDGGSDSEDEEDEQEEDALKLNRDATTSYDEFSGIKWVQCVKSWGDPDGDAIRAGSMVGDIYHCSTEESVEDDGEELGEHKVFEDFKEGSDRYWYWNGFQWVDGNTYFSSLGTERVIFYKNEGRLQDDADDSEQDTTGTSALSRGCYNSTKAIFIGRTASMKACGNVLAVNLGQGLERHAAIFYKSKTIWDRPAHGSFDSVNDKKKRHFVDGEGNKMEEMMVCVCNAFTLLTYSIADNKQVFRLWANAAEDESGYSAVFDYDDVPDLREWRESGCKNDNSIHRDENGNMVYPDYMVLHSRSAKKLYLFYKNKLLKVYQDGEWHNGLPVTGINAPGSRGPSVTLVQTGPIGGDCCKDVHLEFTGILSSYCVPCDIWLDGSLYRRFAGGRVFGDGVATAVFGGLGLAATSGDDSRGYLGYDILQLTGLGKTFVVPHHMGITFISSFAGYSSPSDPKATSVYAIPDTPGLPGVLGEVAPWAPVNRSMDVIRRGWCFFTTEFNGSDKAAIKGYNIWDVTMSELRDLWYKKTTFTSPCGCKGIAYLVQSAGHAPLGATGPTNAKSFWAASRYFYRPISSYASSENYDSDPMSSGDSRQALMWEKLWEDYGYKDKKVSDVFRLGCAGACIWDYADLDNAPFDEPDFTYTYNNKTRYCKYYDHGNTFPGFASNAYSNIYEDGSIIWGVSFIFGGHRDYAEEWDWVSTGATSSSVEATICGKTYQCDDLYYDALLSDRTKIHDINCTYYLVVLKDNKWHIVDTFGNVPANRCFTSNAHPYTHDLEYTGGKLLLQSPENPYNGFVRYDPQGTTSIPGDILVPLPEAPSEPDGMYIAPGHETTFLDCEGNDFIEYEEVGRHDSGSDHYIDYSIYDKHGQAISGCAYKHCYETELFYSQHHDIAYAIHGSKLNRVGPHGIAGSNDEKYDLYIVRVANAGQVPGYLTEGTSSVAAIITGPTADGLNIVRVVKTHLCHGQGHQGLLCSDTSNSYAVVYEGTVEDRGGILHGTGPWAVLKQGYGFASDSRIGYAFWQITGDYGIVIRIKDGELAISNEAVHSPCKESKAKYKCGKYSIGVNVVSHPSSHIEYNEYGLPYQVSMTTYTYDYHVFYGGRDLESEKNLDDEDSVPKFLACCGSPSDYVILSNGHVYYKENLLGNVSVAEKYSWGLSCCGKAALFTRTERDGDGTPVAAKQLLLIDGSPVPPFISLSDEGEENGGGGLRASFSSALWKTIDIKNGEPTYSLSCCGMDYYLLQRGEYVRKHEPNVTRIATTGLINDQVPINTFDSVIDRDPSKTYGILEDGTRVYLKEVQTIKYTNTFYQEVQTEDSYELVVDHKDRYTIEYPLIWTTCHEDKLYDFDMSPLTVDEYKKRCGEENIKDTVFTEDGMVAAVSFYHDINYSLIQTGTNTEETYEIKEQTARFVPWKTKKEMEHREAFVYYKTSLISTDPRVKEITCFRYENEGTYTIPEYHATAAYSIFYDDPFNDCYERSEFNRSKKDLDSSFTHIFNTYTERPAVQNIIGVAKVNKGRNAKERILVDTTPPSMELEYLDEHNEVKLRTKAPSCDCPGSIIDEEDSAGTPVDSSKFSAEDCFCIGKGRMTAVYPNVCLLVWHKARCMSRLVQGDDRDIHKNDTPHIPFWDGTGWDGENTQYMYKGIRGDKTIIDYRNNVIYINDLNAAGRWDRVSGDDPVDEWDINWPYTTECAGFGGFWVSAPDYHPEKTPSEPHDPDGRLVVSGNNTLFVFDKKFGMMAYDILTGKRIRFS